MIERALLTHRWHPNKHYHAKAKRPLDLWNQVVLHITQIQGLKPPCNVKFSLILRTLVSSKQGSYFSAVVLSVYSVVPAGGVSLHG